MSAPLGFGTAPSGQTAAEAIVVRGYALGQPGHSHLTLKERVLCPCGCMLDRARLQEGLILIPRGSTKLLTDSNRLDDSRWQFWGPTNWGPYPLG